MVDAIDAIDVPFGDMDQAFRDGQGDYIHQQGPAPQQLERDGVGHVVASVGKAVGMPGILMDIRAIISIVTGDGVATAMAILI